MPKEVNGDHHSSGPNGNHTHERPTQFIACVRTQRSAARLKEELASHFQHPVPVVVSQGNNVSAVNAASTIILGFQPQDLTSCLQEDGLAEALQGKLVISILAGITVPMLEVCIYRPSFAGRSPPASILRAMPNTCAINNTSTTLLTVSPEHQHSPQTLNFAKTLFSSIGSVHFVPPGEMNAGTALCGSTPAFFALILDGLLDGAVALGLKRSEARILVAETMKGLAADVASGRDTGEVIEKVCTPGGSTIQGLLALERGGVRGVLADALCTSAGANEAMGRR